MSKKPIPSFDTATIEAVAAILGETNQGLTNTQIEKVLAASKIREPVTEARAANPLVAQRLDYVSVSKRDRIARAIIDNQLKQQDGNALVRFITEAMKPAAVSFPKEKTRCDPRHVVWGVCPILVRGPQWWPRPSQSSASG